ncbi:hypothetical protein HPB51_022971 [Rhipicephalus microplus]|uniref:Hydantoinase A/oxoprolinase domain-containing protein n=1 Tax=Rhipicephalus microplus TaxID=6941 RepID=A0A9J6DDE6_RHIMP|nr:hypothetical protein HPB51_022971 [Rhipicephalus microplus]
MLSWTLVQWQLVVALCSFFDLGFLLWDQSRLERILDLCAIEKVNSFLKSQPGSANKHMTLEQVAMGFINVANESMCRPIRALTQGKGFDVSTHLLACFGGAGAQHACAIARALGMTKVLIHSQNIVVEPFLNMRYDRTDCALMCPPEATKSGTNTSPASTSGQAVSTFGNFEMSFMSRYKREFGFVLQGRNIIVDDIRVRAVGRTCLPESECLDPGEEKSAQPIQVDALPLHHCCFHHEAFPAVGKFVEEEKCEDFGRRIHEDASVVKC